MYTCICHLKEDYYSYTQHYYSHSFGVTSSNYLDLKMISKKAYLYFHDHEFHSCLHIILVILQMFLICHWLCHKLWHIKSTGVSLYEQWTPEEHCCDSEKVMEKFDLFQKWIICSVALISSFTITSFPYFSLYNNEFFILYSKYYYYIIKQYNVQTIVIFCTLFSHSYQEHVFGNKKKSQKYCCSFVLLKFGHNITVLFFMQIIFS